MPAKVTERITSDRKDVAAGICGCLLCDREIEVAFDVITRLMAGDLIWCCFRTSHEVRPVGELKPMPAFRHNEANLSGLT